MDNATIDNPWALIALLGTTFITGLFGWLTLRAKGESDEKDKGASAVMKEVEQQENLRPVVTELVRQMGKVQLELAESRAIVKVKYPIALQHISSFHQLFPGSGLQIPDQLRDDL